MGSSLRSESLVLKRLHAMEVTLNQIINQFLCLAPSAFGNLVFERALGEPILGEFLFSGRDFAEKRPGWDTCQPDFQFISADGCSSVFIEMKIESYSRIDQVFKYAARALSNEQVRGGQMQSSLIFLGKSSFKGIWPKSLGITTVEHLHSAIVSGQGSFCDLRLKNAADLRVRFAQILTNMRFGFISYADFGEMVLAEHQSAVTMGSMVYERLLDGMLQELRRRKLVPTEEAGHAANPSAV